MASRRISIFEQKANDRVELVKQDGTRHLVPKVTVKHRTDTISIYAADELPCPLQRGDVLVWHVPNGTVEEFVVEDPHYSDSSMLGPHYDATVRNRQAPAPVGSTSYHVNVSGTNARANVHSQDHSVNIACVDKQTTVFNDLRQAIENNIPDLSAKDDLLRRVEELEAAKNQPSFLATLAGFTTAAQNFTTVIQPFLAPLIQWGSQLGM